MTRKGFIRKLWISSEMLIDYVFLNFPFRVLLWTADSDSPGPTIYTTSRESMGMDGKCPLLVWGCVQARESSENCSVSLSGEVDF